MTPIEKMQHQIDSLPKEHSPKPFTVTCFDQYGNEINTQSITASSKQRAELTAIKSNRFLFAKKQTASAIATNKIQCVKCNLITEIKPVFGSCDMRQKDRKIQPPENSRGIIARTYI